MRTAFDRGQVIQNSDGLLMIVQDQDVGENTYRVREPGHSHDTVIVLGRNTEWKLATTETKVAVVRTLMREKELLERKIFDLMDSSR